MESAQRIEATRPAQGNRLTLSLLLLWMFAIGLVIVWHRPWVIGSLPESAVLTEGLSRGELLRLLVAPALGCGVGSVIYWLVPWLRRHSFPCQPGHWLLLAFGFFWIVAAFSPFLITAEPTQAGLIATSLMLVVGCFGKMTHFWRLSLVALAAALIWRSYLVAQHLDGPWLDFVFHRRHRELHLSLNWISVVMLAISARADHVFHVRRDFLHFAGIAVSLTLLFAASERYLGFLPWNW